MLVFGEEHQFGKDGWYSKCQRITTEISENTLESTQLQTESLLKLWKAFSILWRTCMCNNMQLEISKGTFSTDSLSTFSRIAMQIR